MRSALLLSIGLAGLALASPVPQDIDVDGVEAAPDPVLVTPALDVQSQVATVLPVSSQAAAASAAVASDPASIAPSSDPTAAPQKRSIGVEKRDGTCALQPAGAWPASTPDTSSGFLSDPVLQDPNAIGCPDPASTTNFKCTLWGAPVSAAQATNQGQGRDSFQVVITASNAYNRVSSPPAIPGFLTPVTYNTYAINAPLDAQGYNTYMGYKYFAFSQSQGDTPQTCASACTAQTSYNQRHPASDGSYQTCTFFNAYVLYKNNAAQGPYCSLYNETWAASYAINHGQVSNGATYTIGYSYGYSLDLVVAAEAVITSQLLQPFCTSFLGTTATVTVSSGTATSSTTTTATATSTTFATLQAKRTITLALSTPSALATFAPSVLSSACSVEASPVTSTSTVFTTTTVPATKTVATTVTTVTTVSTNTVTPSPTSTVTCTAADQTNIVATDGQSYSIQCNAEVFGLGGSFPSVEVSGSEAIGECIEALVAYNFANQQTVSNAVQMQGTTCNFLALNSNWHSIHFRPFGSVIDHVAFLSSLPLPEWAYRM